jgi:tRNA threonylcarbamoyladenosine biosynthesis protein TsaB
MILAIRTDKPEAELYLYQDGKQVDLLTWHAHRELSDTLLLKIDELVDRNDIEKMKLEGIAVFKGPGSFTGLRIGISVANALAYSLNIPVCGGAGDDWITDSLKDINNSSEHSVVMPEYGSGAHITQPRK